MIRWVGSKAVIASATNTYKLNKLLTGRAPSAALASVSQVHSKKSSTYRPPSPFAKYILHDESFRHGNRILPLPEASISRRVISLNVIHMRNFSLSLFEKVDRRVSHSSLVRCVVGALLGFIETNRLYYSAGFIHLALPQSRMFRLLAVTDPDTAIVSYWSAIPGVEKSL